jgi:hypothetical protein
MYGHGSNSFAHGEARNRGMGGGDALLAMIQVDSW